MEQITEKKKWLPSDTRNRLIDLCKIGISPRASWLGNRRGQKRAEPVPQRENRQLVS